MHVIGIVHGRGGVGKSTRSANLARSLQLRDLDVCLIDGGAHLEKMHAAPPYR
jgi:chromosome partitioning protein